MLKSWMMAGAMMASLGASAAWAGLPSSYNRALAQRQIEGLLLEAVKKGVGNSTDHKKYLSALREHPEMVDGLAEQIFSEGVDIGSPAANLTPAQILDQLSGKMNDGKGQVETSLTAGRARKPTTPQAASALVSRMAAPTLSAGSAKASVPVGSKSMISDASSDTALVLDYRWKKAGGDYDK